MKPLTSNHIIYIVLLAAIPTLLYSFFSWNPIVFDDEPFFTGGAVYQYNNTFSPLTPRWLPLATLSWTYNHIGHDLVYFRSVNLALHIGNSIALFTLILQLYKAATPHPISHNELTKVQLIAFFGAMIFALHPVTVYATAYLMQRTILMATLFSLLCLISYLHGLINKNNRWFLIAAAFYFLAVFSKEHSVLIPAIAMAITLAIFKPSIELLKQIALPFTLFFAIAIFITFRMSGYIGEAYEPMANELLQQMSHFDHVDPALAYPLSILTQSHLFFKYLSLYLIPSPAWMSIDMREPFTTQLVSWTYTISAIGFIIYPCIGAWLLLQRGRKGLLGLAMLYPWILFLVELSTVRIQEPFVLYRSYLWLPGLFVALPILLRKLEKVKCITILSIACLLLTALSWNRLETFSHPLRLWNDAEILIQNDNESLWRERIYHNRGYAYLHLSHFDEAITDFNKALSINPKLYFSYFSRGRAFYETGKHSEALSDFNQYITLRPSSAVGYRARGLTLGAMGDMANANKNFLIGCSLGDDDSCKKIDMKKPIHPNT